MAGCVLLTHLFVVNLEPHSRDLSIESIFISVCLVNFFFFGRCGDGEASELFLTSDETLALSEFTLAVAEYSCLLCPRPVRGGSIKR